MPLGYSQLVFSELFVPLQDTCLYKQGTCRRRLRWALGQEASEDRALCVSFKYNNLDPSH